MNLKNKVAIVTGSGQGIGLGIAEELAHQGCMVVISDINYKKCLAAQKKLNALGVKSAAVKCDVSKKQEVRNLINRTIKTFGKLDILVNNAGIYPYMEFEKMKEADWDKVININLKGTYLCIQAAIKNMKSEGKIINISSIAATKGFQNLAHYCASKGGVNALTRALATELSPKNININAIAPGAIETPGVKIDEKTKKQTVSMIPWGRMGKPKDIAKTVSFLASGEADYITGQVITVDGGWTIK